MIRSRTKVRVRYAETDNMGFVYHSNYFIWFEVGRVHMLDEIDLPYHAIEVAGCPG